MSCLVVHLLELVDLGSTLDTPLHTHKHTIHYTLIITDILKVRMQFTESA